MKSLILSLCAKQKAPPLVQTVRSDQKKKTTIFPPLCGRQVPKTVKMRSALSAFLRAEQRREERKQKQKKTKISRGQKTEKQTNNKLCYYTSFFKNTKKRNTRTTKMKERNIAMKTKRKKGKKGSDHKNTCCFPAQRLSFVCSFHPFLFTSQNISLPCNVAFLFLFVLLFLVHPIFFVTF